MVYEDDELENIEYFCKRVIDLIQVYKTNKCSEVLFELINETIMAINASTKK